MGPFRGIAAGLFLILTPAPVNMLHHNINSPGRVGARTIHEAHTSGFFLNLGICRWFLSITNALGSGHPVVLPYISRGPDLVVPLRHPGAIRTTTS